MMKVNAAWFVFALNNIGFCEGALEGGAAIGDATSTQTIEKINQLIEHLPAASAPATIASLRLLKNEWVGTGTIPKSRLRALLQNVTQNLQAEFSGRSLWLFSAEEQAIYAKSCKPFGDAVFNTFPEMREDLEEAAICLAINRNTASVFHLMRSMEIAVGLISHQLTGVKEQKVWGLLLADIKTAIDGMAKGPERTAWSHAHSLLFGVKEAWRNEVMHPKKAYTSEQALDVYGACRSFLRHLASLVEPPQPIAT